MESLLVSLALLLLASLCYAELETWRNTTGNAIAWDEKADKRLSLAAIVTEHDKRRVLNLFTNDDEIQSKLSVALGGNTVFALAFDSNNWWDKVEPHFMEAIYNGVLCDNITTDHEDVIREILYGGDTEIISKDDRKSEEKRARKRFGIDCRSASPDICFCKEKKVLPYCLALRMTKKIEDSGYIMKRCDHEILESMLEEYPQEKGSEELNDRVFRYISMYNDVELGRKSFGRASVRQSTIEWYRKNKPEKEKELAEFYCEAVEPRAANIVKELYAANPMRWMLERTDYTVYGRLKMNVYYDCLTNVNFTATEFGSCLCKLDKGFTFCHYNVLAKYMTQEGYLNCATLSFNTTVDVTDSLAFSMPASSMTVSVLLSTLLIFLVMLLN